MTRLYGWARGGDRVVDAAPLRRWHSTTMLAAIRVDGVIPQACATYEGGTTGEVFRFYVEDMLAPQLRPGDVVVMDNLGSHKVAGIREAIEARGAELR